MDLLQVLAWKPQVTRCQRWHPRMTIGMLDLHDALHKGNEAGHLVALLESGGLNPMHLANLRE